jgi:hypothetical protein
MPKHNYSKRLKSKNLDRASFTLDEWCARRRVSRSSFYKMPESLRPRTHNAGVKVLVSAEADEEWLRERESESANSAA